MIITCPALFSKMTLKMKETVDVFTVKKPRYSVADLEGKDPSCFGHKFTIKLRPVSEILNPPLIL
jgi:hypothetical protein